MHPALDLESVFFPKQKADCTHSNLSRLASGRTITIFYVLIANYQNDPKYINKSTVFSSKRSRPFGCGMGLGGESYECDLAKCHLTRTFI